MVYRSSNSHKYGVNWVHVSYQRPYGTRNHDPKHNWPVPTGTCTHSLLP